MNHTSDVSKVITNILEQIFHGIYCDIPKVQLYCSYVENILITILNAKRIGIPINPTSGYLPALNKMVTYGLLSNDIPSFWSMHEKIIQNAFDDIKILEMDNPHFIHEYLLEKELHITEKKLELISGKASRDTIGAYYTPGSLALDVVHEAITKYLKINAISTKLDAIELLSKTKFADFSCGCGEFIKAVMKYLEDRYAIEPEISSLNLYGIDIDPIALQITICDLLVISSKDRWHEIISHFTLGNPLIDYDGENDITIKTQLFACGRYYAKGMGINMKMFESIKIDIVVGNPPWEKIRFEERKFFKSIVPAISNISQKNKRQTEIEQLRILMPTCYDWYQQIYSDYIQYKDDVINHSLINKSLNGELNTYALFTELSLNLIAKDGVSSLIVKSAIATSPANKPFFTHIVNHQNLSSICLYVNSYKIFAIDSRENFCVLTCTKQQNHVFELIAGAKKIGDLHSLERMLLSASEVKTINPNTQMIPNVMDNNEIMILLDTHRRLPLFDTVYPKCHFGRLVHLTTHANHIDITPDDNNLPIYEGKFIERYNARFATFAGLTNSQKFSAKAYAKKNAPSDMISPMPESRYFIHTEFWNKLSVKYSESYMLCWRSLTSSTNTRTTLAMLLPTMPTCQSIQFLQTENTKDLLILLALFNSKPFDYFVRLKMPGIDLTQSVIRQIPVPSHDVYQQQIKFAGISKTMESHILDRVSAILSNEPMMSQLLQELSMPTLAKKKNKNLYSTSAMSHLRGDFSQIEEVVSPLAKKASKKTPTKSCGKLTAKAALTKLNTGSKSSSLEEELDDLLFIAYGLSDVEIKAIKASFKV